MREEGNLKEDTRVSLVDVEGAGVVEVSSDSSTSGSSTKSSYTVSILFILSFDIIYGAKSSGVIFGFFILFTTSAFCANQSNAFSL